MKKLSIALVLALVCVMILGTTALAAKPNDKGAVKIEGIHWTAGYEDVCGFMIYNATPDGRGTDISMQIQIRNAEPNYTYLLKSDGVVRGEITTNAQGNGGAHVNLVEGDAALGVYMNVRDGSAFVLRFEIP